MNSVSYAVLRIARSFGYGNRHGHLRAAQRENTFVSEAEGILGHMAWQDMEHIEDLAEEYWQIVEINAHQEKLRNEILALESENRNLSKDHDRLEANLDVRVQGLIDKKSEKMQAALSSMHELETLRDKSEFTRKRYNGLKTKYKVQTDQGVSSEELEVVRRELEELKQRHDEETHLIEEKTKLIHEFESKALNIDDQISKVRQEAKGRITAMMTEVGKSSNFVAKHSAMIGSLERQKNELTLKIGQYISSFAQDKRSASIPKYRAILNKHGKILSKIQSLQKSIKYHRLLGGLESED